MKREYGVSSMADDTYSTPSPQVVRGRVKDETKTVSDEKCVCVIVLLQQKLYNRPPPPLPYIWVPNNCPYNAIVTLFSLPKLTTSLNGPFKVGSMAIKILG